MTIERNAVRCTACGSEIESSGRKAHCKCGEVTIYGGLEILGRIAPARRGFIELAEYSGRAPFAYYSRKRGYRLLGDMNDQ